MLQKNVYSPFRKPELSCLHALSFISLVVLILFIATTNVYSSQFTFALSQNTESDLTASSTSFPATTFSISKINLSRLELIRFPAATFSISKINLSRLELTSFPAATFFISKINFFWNASSDNIGATGYTMYKDSTQIATIPNTTYQDTGLSSPATYSYTISDYDAAGNEFGQSSASSATTLSLPANNHPVLSSVGNKSVNEGQAISFAISATDPDGDTLSYTTNNLPSGASFNENTKTFAWTPTYNQAGTYSNITFQVGDGIDIDSESITITVLHQDFTAPTITSVKADGSSTQVILSFSEPVEEASATNVSNYSIDNAISVFSASLDSDQKTVTLSTSKHVDGTSYDLTVNHITDLASIPNMIAFNTTVSYNFMDILVISNLTVKSGQIYEIVANGLQNGSTVYIDKEYIYSSVPTLMEGATYIKTANSDKGKSSPSFLTFDVNQAATVYVAHDDLSTTKPSWLTSFVDTGDDLVTMNSTLSVFTKNFFGGTITLGGDEGKVKKSMYTVIIVKYNDGGSECTDTDGDGWCIEEGDCDDDNPHVYPGHKDKKGRWGRDNVDNDCNGIIDG